MNLYVVTSREYEKFCSPQVFKSEESADKFVRTCIVNDLCENYNEEMSAAGLDCITSDPDEIITWGIANDLCTTDASIVKDKWHEFQITPVLIEDIFHNKILSLMDELEEIRQKAAENPICYPTDFAIRLCEASVAKNFSIKSRDAWTSELKANPNSKYQARYYNGNFHI